MLRTEFNKIAEEGSKRCTSCGGFGHVSASPCPTAKWIAKIKTGNSELKSILDAAEK
jgi:hypothetical protein